LLFTPEKFRGTKELAIILKALSKIETNGI
jgi:hypothetical protein